MHVQKPDQSLLSKLGNPYPPGLTPVRLDDTQPLGPVDLPDLSGHQRITEFRYATVPPGRPVLPLYMWPRAAHQTEAQYEVSRREVEDYHVDVMLVIHHMAQLLATHLGNARHCRVGHCRRIRRCGGQRDQREVGGFDVLFPPCIPLDREIIWTWFEAIRAEIRHVAAQAKAPVAQQDDRATGTLKGSGHRRGAAQRAGPDR